jgi:hypothetical protein
MILGKIQLRRHSQLAPKQATPVIKYIARSRHNNISPSPNKRVEKNAIDPQIIPIQITKPKLEKGFAGDENPAITNKVKF